MDVEEIQKTISQMLEDEMPLVDIEFHLGRCSAFRFFLDLLDDAHEKKRIGHAS